MINLTCLTDFIKVVAMDSFGTQQHNSVNVSKHPLQAD